MGEFMKKLGVIVIVAIGLLAVLQGTAYLGFAFSSASPGAGMDGSWLLNAMSLALPMGGAFAIGFLLIAYRDRLANRWFEDGEVSTPVDAPSLLRVVLLAIGVWMVASATPELIGSIMTAFTIRVGGYSQELGLAPSFFSMAPRALPQILEIAVGIVLIARSEPLARRLWQGRPTVEQPPASPLSACPSCGEPYAPGDYGDVENAKCSRCKEPLNMGRA
jgi:hypothetical protein